GRAPAAAPPTVAGRWSLLPAAEGEPTHRAHALARTLLDRHGVVTRGAVAAEGVEGGFSAAYRVLSAFEESGQARRGYVVEGLGAAQFAMDGAVDRLRAVSTAREREGGVPGAYGGPHRSGAPAGSGALVLAAADPANAYGAALPWPPPPPGATHKPGRKAGALVVLVDGALTLYVERGGKTLLAWARAPAAPEGAAGEPEGASAAGAADRPDSAQVVAAVEALAEAARRGALGTVTVERVNGTAALSSPLSATLEAAGFHPTPRGLRLRAR
ncbi:DEAD/DEAH box helicase, partial [Streptomyces sp. NPDC006992]